MELSCKLNTHVIKGTCFLDDNSFFNNVCIYTEFRWIGKGEMYFTSFRLTKY